MSGLTLDAGALIAIDRGDREMFAAVGLANRTRTKIAVPAGALSQVWRDGRTQARLAKFLKSKLVEQVPLDAAMARAAGELCGRRGTDDPIDASVVLCARKRGHTVVTSDPEDLRRLDPSIQLKVV